MQKVSPDYQIEKYNQNKSTAGELYFNNFVS